MIGGIVFELTLKNYKTTLFGHISTLWQHGKGVSNHQRNLEQLFLSKKKKIWELTKLVQKHL